MPAQHEKLRAQVRKRRGDKKRDGERFEQQRYAANVKLLPTANGAIAFSPKAAASAAIARQRIGVAHQVALHEQTKGSYTIHV